MVVLVGTTPFGHTTEAGQVIVLPAVASFVKCNVNATVSPDGTDPKLNTHVAFPVKVAVTKFPFERSRVGAVPVLPKAYRFSA